jgi:hypothetical protein
MSNVTLFRAGSGNFSVDIQERQEQLLEIRKKYQELIQN